MRRVNAVFLAFLLVLGLANIAHAERPDVRLSVGFGYLQGDTTYQIGGHYTSPQYGEGDTPNPLSELSWPIDVLFLSAELNASWWRLSGNAFYRTNTSEPKGKMEDSDWGIYTSDPSSLDSYSESCENLDAQIWGGDIRIAFLKGKGWDLLAGIGYLQQTFKFDGYNSTQWYPSHPEWGRDYFNGRTITYNVTYQIPYGEIGFDFYTKKFKGNLFYKYSPFVNAEDIDHHLLRNKTGKGYDDGYSNEVKFFCTYDITKHWFAGFDFGWTQINTSGIQRQHQGQYVDSDGVLHQEYLLDIDNSITSEQLTTMLSAGFKF